MSFDLFADDDDVSIEYLHLSSQSVATEDSPLFSDLTLSAAQSPQLSISQSTHSAAETQQTATCSALETVTSPSIARDRPNDNQSPSVASSQETKPKKTTEAYRGIGSGKRDDQQPGPPITGQLFTISAPKTCACCVCEFTAPPVSSPVTAVNWVACDGEGCPLLSYSDMRPSPSDQQRSIFLPMS